MPKAVNKIEFWKERIDTAQKDHYMVYVTGEQDWRRINEKHKELIAKYINPNDRVLDAGCGYGRMSVHFKPDNYVGADFSPDFIEQAEKRFPGYRYIVGDLKKLKFKKGEFDWAICVSIKRMITDNLGEEEWKKMEKELKRVAKKVLILEYEDPNEHEVI